MKLHLYLLLSAMIAFGAGCSSFSPSPDPNPEYGYIPGPPPIEERDVHWEGFGQPSTMDSNLRLFNNVVGLENNPRVLWVIADTYGNQNEMDPEWFIERPWFLNSQRLRFVQPENAPNKKQHPHGFNCFSRGWPLLYEYPNVDFVLFRMIDVENGEEALLDFLDEELEKYEGRVVVSNSWGIPRQYNADDEYYAALWAEWSARIDKMGVDYPNFTAVFSSGNSGPDFSGFPQSIMTNAVIVGASNKLGYMADFSSQDHNTFCVAGGHKTLVANPDKAGSFDIASGTSFSCPTVAAMITRLIAENPAWDRETTLSVLRTMCVPSPQAFGRNPVWGFGEVEHFNQTVPADVWRELGYPKGFGARVRNFLAVDTMVPMPKPMLPNPKFLREIIEK